MTRNKTTNAIEDLLSLYTEVTGAEASSYTRIEGSASDRIYYNIDGPTKLIGVIGTDIAENRAFIEIDSALSRQHVNVPKVIAYTHDYQCYLQTHLGHISLYDLIRQYGFTPSVIGMCRKSIDQLVKFQITGHATVDTSRCYPVAEMNAESIMWDLNYFKYCFLKNTLLKIDEARLEKEFHNLASKIDSIHPRLFIHRDFQSRNILIHDDDSWIIDFQGGRIGPSAYDIVSFLWQARANFDSALRDQLLSYYLEKLTAHTNIIPENFMAQIPDVIMFRMIQVLGAYGFRGLVEKKEQFITSIPQALENLRHALELSDIPYPYLYETTSQLIESFNTDITPSRSFDNSTLTVVVTSFSYKKGLPIDETGNGGGYVFDCRSIHNPGRYDEYKNLTGDDTPVIEFLENDGEITRFLTHCKALTDASVERYMERHFSSLTISFGCTGGQHRSVYSASHMAQHLHDKYGIEVILIHREQNIKQTYSRK